MGRCPTTPLPCHALWTTRLLQHAAFSSALPLALQMLFEALNKVQQIDSPSEGFIVRWKRLSVLPAIAMLDPRRSHRPHRSSILDPLIVKGRLEAICAFDSRPGSAAPNAAPLRPPSGRCDMVKSTDSNTLAFSLASAQACWRQLSTSVRHNAASQRLPKKQAAFAHQQQSRLSSRPRMIRTTYFMCVTLASRHGYRVHCSLADGAKRHYYHRTLLLPLVAEAYSCHLATKACAPSSDGAFASRTYVLREASAQLCMR